MDRISIKDLEPNAYKAMLGLEQYIRNSQISPMLLELIKIRASQINCCAYCIDMHTQEALKIGETQRRIFALSAWKESPLFTEDEREVLQLTEEITLISKDGVSNETYDKVIKAYGENGLAQIIMQVIIINSWNRIAVSTKQIFG
ncbi:carboxymuconolactone decarboxylase family protein [Mucilaginibacter flavidus]|uniref:carboxymuconolactone decarboxylase family protein n=1 Tax=Mucilaginibacter flavidus TaxID=2949309 RepID=UPI0020921FCF|nr:carboxymuconolactone decarboxylase family protein [Mucilaginibacter flavidus]MCO5948583.1 carboxymuconolactone decarboxylase family protein [Mucilaginibacter flavidus]